MAELSAEQRAVVSAREPSVVVSAAAGAGKTFVLVERYLRHVQDEGLDPSQILTITFTKKAAAEMKRRIVRELRARGLHEQAQAAETGPVQTIHSFCERLLRENALEAGLDPGFEILAEAQAGRLITACVREALASPLEEEPQAEALVSYLAGKRGYGGRSPYAQLESAVENTLQALRGSGWTQLQLRQWHEDPQALGTRWEEVLIAALPEAAQRTLANVEAPTLVERLVQACRAAGLRGIPGFLRGSRPEAGTEEEALIHTCGLVQLACAAWWRLDREMDAAQALDFTALEMRAVRLLKGSEVTRERVREAYRVVMVDEAQDVNPIQHELLFAMGLGRELFVGDVQQSIYGFRQADVRLFQARAERARELRLSKNYRSEAGILSFVDLLFGALWGEGYAPMNRPDAAMDFDAPSMLDCSGVEFWRMNKNDLDAAAHYVQELMAEGVPLRDIAILTRDGGGAMKVKGALDGMGIPARIHGGSERFYTRLEVRDLANALRALADPYDDFALLACLRSPVVGLSLDSVALLGLQSSVVERLETFEPPLPEDGPRLRAFLQWYLPLKGYADRLSAWEVLAEVFAKSDFLPALARRENADGLLANARKLLTLAAEEPELGPLEYAERIREIGELRHREGDAPSGEEDADEITIMTVHKAKGLEFPVVILPQTDKRLTGNAPDAIVEPRMGLVATKYGKGQCLMHRYLGERRKERDVEEELRVLYVALTRAKSRLCVCLYPQDTRDNASKRIQKVMGTVPPPGVRVRDSQVMAAV